MREPHRTRLSKTRLMSGHRCIRKLWIEITEPDSLTVAEADIPRTVRWGRHVGVAARAFFRGGELIQGDTRERIAATKDALSRGGRVLFEATFSHRGVDASADVLSRRGTGYVLTEVKSSTRVKDEHLLDVAIQMWVISGAGLDVKRAEVAVLNRNFRHPDHGKLFVRHDVTRKAKRLARSIPKMVQQVRRGIGSSSLPVVQPGDHCHSPYPCSFLDRCWADQPRHHVSELYRIGERQLGGLLRRGIETIHDVPKTTRLSVIANRQRRAVQSRRVIVEEGLSDALAGMRAPVGYLDFETVALPIPRWTGCRPYDQVPVQFSFHVETARGLRHAEWIANGAYDPRPGIAAALVKACSGAKTILAYSANFERGCIDGLIEAVPHLAKKLGSIRDRIDDLLPIVRAHVYHPEFHGSFSLKSVHPALTGRDVYGAMDIGDGETAMDALERLMFDRMPQRERARLRRALLRYCATDTRVMIELRKRLLALF